MVRSCLLLPRGVTKFFVYVNFILYSFAIRSKSTFILGIGKGRIFVIGRLGYAEAPNRR